MSEIPLVKYIIIGIFIMILVSLGTAFVSMMRGKDRSSTSTVRALTVRVGLSIGLVIMIIVLNALGIIEPNA